MTQLHGNSKCKQKYRLGFSVTTNVCSIQVEPGLTNNVWSSLPTPPQATKKKNNFTSKQYSSKFTICKRPRGCWLTSPAHNIKVIFDTSSSHCGWMLKPVQKSLCLGLKGNVICVDINGKLPSSHVTCWIVFFPPTMFVWGIFASRGSPTCALPD